MEEEGEGGGGDFVHVAEVALETVGAAVAEEVGGEDGVAPGGEVDADFLEEPASVGAVAVGHKDGGFDLVGLEVEREEGLGEDFAVGGFEVGLGVANALGGVVFFFRGVAPEVRGSL